MAQKKKSRSISRRKPVRKPARKRAATPRRRNTRRPAAKKRAATRRTNGQLDRWISAKRVRVRKVGAGKNARVEVDIVR